MQGERGLTGSPFLAEYGNGFHGFPNCWQFGNTAIHLAALPALWHASLP
jgi:hypothetical protein